MWIALCATALPADAFFSNTQKGPITIAAQGQLVCERAKAQCTAQDSVVVDYGAWRMTCDTLTAYFSHNQNNDSPPTTESATSFVTFHTYTPKALEAQGHVTIQGGRFIVRSRKAHYNASTQIATLSGDIKLQAPQFHGTCQDHFIFSMAKQHAHGKAPRLTLHDKNADINADTVDLYTTTGEPATLKKAIFAGKCVFKTPREAIHADQAIYCVKTQTLTLNGHTKARHGKHFVSCSHAVYHIPSEQLSLSCTPPPTTPQDSERVSGVLYHDAPPQDSVLQ